MKLSKHAEARRQQRGIPLIGLDIIQKHGRIQNAPGGAQKVFFGRKEWQMAISDLKRTIQLMDKLRNGTMIIEGDYVLTVYK